MKGNRLRDISMLQTLCWLILVPALTSCGTVKEKLSFTGAGEARQVGPQRFEVTEGGNDYFENRKEVVDRWEKRAAAACKGTYQVVNRNYDATQSPLVRLTGIIECESSVAKPNPSSPQPPISPAVSSPAASPTGSTPRVGEPATVSPTPKVASPALSLAEAQTRLTSLGYDPGAVDGKMGPRTTNAIRQFQRDRGLTVTGVLDAATQNALR